MDKKVDIVQLASCQILDENGQSLRLASLWQEQTAVLIYLRHFACVACRAHALQVWQNREKIQGANSRLYFIGNGMPQFISSFKSELGLEGAPVFTDPSLGAFYAAGFLRGFVRAAGPKSMMNVRRLVKEGHTQTSYQKGMGDIWQLGGILVIKKDGRVAYHYISEAAGDFPIEEDLQGMPWNSD